VVGLLWADQNLRDLGLNHRLLLSSERSACFNLINNLSPSELKGLEDSPYFKGLNKHLAHIDNIFTTNFIQENNL